jgi:hypothetical protein
MKHMPTGLHNSPTLLTGTPATSSIPRAAINRSTHLTFATTGVAQVFPSIHVPAGCTVYIRGDKGNVAIAYVAMDRETLGIGAGDPVTADTEISYPADRAGQVWAQGTQNDGLTLSIRGGTQNF